MIHFKPIDWYWDDGNDVFSSSRLARFPYTDIIYQTWLSNGNVATRDPGITDLRDILIMYNIGRRLMVDIFFDVKSLNAGQLTNISTDLFASPRPVEGQKWENNTGPSLAAMNLILATAGSFASMTLTQKEIITSFYVYDNPSYLVHPIFDPTINISGMVF